MKHLYDKSSLTGWRKKMFEVIFEADTFAGKLFDVVLMINIVASVTVIMLLSVESVRINHGNLLNALEWCFTVLFTIEYIFRLICVNRPLRYAFSFFGVVDLLSILPTYLRTKTAIDDGLEYYIGLEHLDPQSLRIQRKGVIAEDNPSFTRLFKPGQILFGKRRAYQKKAAVADFTGICSGDIIVIDAVPGKIISKLLPFIVQSDMFFDWAVKTSSGSLSPRTKWKALAELEFPLPPLERQKEILEVFNLSLNNDWLNEETIIN